ncbi:MAG: hypothetical protein FD145_498 [Candidatus Saganbacteria bacterium]|uniref:Uncharacterized protein n=1 Tax=Candidatus Saganbacteria bacterium TaxID=2575572 RepID=A0A833L1P0_UNCSA|nr:MAG: hypothetical protein FD145_498 [Candidatus Saganbacteria bacterium]
MSRLLDLLGKNKMTLIVELPENTIEMAKAAEQFGADALIVTEHIPELVNSVEIPVGIDISKNEELEEGEVKSYSKYDFINFHCNAMPSASKKIKAGKIITLNDEYSLDKVINVEGLGAQAIDAAIIPISQGVHELVVGDLQNYISIAISSGIPVIIPTQRDLKPSEVAIIADTGAKGIILTSVVLGESIKTLEKAFKEYRIAADDIG